MPTSPTSSRPPPRSSPATRLTFTITVTNSGPSDAQAVNLTDSLPVEVLPGATYTLDFGSGPSAPARWTGTLPLGTLEPGDVVT